MPPPASARFAEEAELRGVVWGLGISRFQHLLGPIRDLTARTAIRIPEHWIAETGEPAHRAGPHHHPERVLTVAQPLGRAIGPAPSGRPAEPLDRDQRTRPGPEIANAYGAGKPNLGLRHFFVTLTFRPAGVSVPPAIRTTAAEWPTCGLLRRKAGLQQAGDPFYSSAMSALMRSSRVS
jgi:hypothetical protein